ncbi:MAG: T9SS type A sorting domain-containing protein, partial [Flavobacteriales bacterium]|nr:T9SS type A sorting domain-containing protein [Flavobacteriales bacterium]
KSKFPKEFNNFFHMDVNYEKMLYNVNVSNGGIFMGLYDENTEIVNNISSNNVFTIPENLNLKETSISNAVFPNPFSNTIQLNLNENSIVKVYNSLGILVDEYKLDKGQQQINTQTLLNGVYILTFQSKSGTENIKLLKN